MTDKQYEYQITEQLIQESWVAHNTYNNFDDISKKLFSIDTPPPTVSGTLHIGHIFSYTHTDIMARYKRLSGYRVFYPFGFDDNGLPTERYVEKKCGVKAHQMARNDFIALCTKESGMAAQQFTRLWQRMGISAYWDAPYSTISDSVRRIAQASFIELFKEKKVYRAHQMALYCVTCQTSVAQAELDDKESSSVLYDIEFTAQHDSTPLVIATSRPELLYSCVALFYNPDDQRYVHLQDKKAVVPFYGREVPILADHRVKQDKGTGLVMCCTFGDTTDVAWHAAYNLPYVQSFNKYGKWIESTGPLFNLKASDARKKIVEVLTEHGALRGQKAIMHVVNTHERCGTDIEYIMIPQWFVATVSVKDALIEASNQVTWCPGFMKSRYTNWVESLSWDWCISRQRFYGIPFPVWHCASCSAILVADTHRLPVDPQSDAYGALCTQCGADQSVTDTDVMDTWNTSSLTPYICKEIFKEATGQELTFPMGMRPQAHDIIRTWAFYTLLKTWLHDQTVPWQTIMISGHVLADSKEKISKSKDNGAMDPLRLLERYPADAIRYWAASGALGADTAFCENELKVGLKLVTKLFNAAKFIAQHVVPYAPVAYAHEIDHVGYLHQWILARAYATETRYHEAFQQCEIHHALSAVEEFFWNDFCDNYLEFVKHQLFHPSEYAAHEVRITKDTLYYVGHLLIQWYAPFLPFITEFIYHMLYSADPALSLHVTEFIKAPHFTHSQSVYALHKGSLLIDLVGAIRKAKSMHQLSLKVPLRAVVVSVNDQVVAQECSHLLTLLPGIINAQAIEIAMDDKQESYTSTTAFLTHDPSADAWSARIFVVVNKE